MKKRSIKDIKIFDWDNPEALRALMRDYGNLGYKLSIKKKNRVSELITIYHECIIRIVYQEDHKIIKYRYWYDGEVEKDFEGFWYTSKAPNINFVT